MAAMDWAQARKRMVDGQLRPNRVTDARLLAAFQDLPRHAFVPEAVRARSHADQDVPLPEGRALLAPMKLGRLLQALSPRAGERVLVAASGPGYGAALLARLGAQVTALEDQPALLALSRAALPEAAPGLRLEASDPAAGWPAGAPYDAILIEGAVPALPEALTAQLAEGGRLATVLRPAGTPGVAVLARRAGGAVSVLELFDCSAPVLPAFAPRPAFAF
jgi:protein-L-isoaspartate(D-aspartate) O-methyltransferase